MTLADYGSKDRLRAHFIRKVKEMRRGGATLREAVSLAGHYVKGYMAVSDEELALDNVVKEMPK